jgi:ankyrin repeat protein
MVARHRGVILASGLALAGTLACAPDARDSPAEEPALESPAPCAAFGPFDAETQREVARLIGVRNVRGQTGLHLTNHPSVAKALIACGEDVDARDAAGWTPLHQQSLAAEYRNSGVAAVLIDAGADVEGRATFESSGPNPYWVNSDETPLLLAVRTGAQAGYITFLLQRGADITAVASLGQGALHLAMDLDLPGDGDNAIEVARVLIAHGVDIDARGVNQRTALHLAAMAGAEPRHPGQVPLLLEHGADANQLDDGGRLALHHLAHAGSQFREGRMFLDPSTYHPEVLSALARATANLEERDAKGWTPFLLAVRADEPQAARLLVELGADAQARSPTGGTALHVLAELASHRSLESFGWLLDAGLDPQARNADGLRPIDLLDRIEENSRVRHNRSFLERAATQCRSTGTARPGECAARPQPSAM